jgi:hypothetical protein
MEGIKMRNFTTIIIGIIVIASLILGIVGVIPLDKVMPIALTFIGLMNLSNGFHEYKNGQKKKGIFILVSGAFIIYVVIYTTWFM